MGLFVEVQKSHGKEKRTSVRKGPNVLLLGASLTSFVIVIVDVVPCH
jgi:hypothetical protein